MSHHPDYPNEFDLKSPEELEAEITKLRARQVAQGLSPALVTKFIGKLQYEANRRRWRASLAAGRARKGG